MRVNLGCRTRHKGSEAGKETLRRESDSSFRFDAPADGRSGSAAHKAPGLRSRNV